MTKTKSKTDIYTQVTNRIIEQLEQGVRPWLKPWNAEHAAGRICRPLRHNEQHYNGVNILMLWDSAEMQGFACPIWLTYRQAKELGGSVNKGEKGTSVVYASTFKKSDTDDTGDEVERDIPFLKQYTVFNAEQCDGLPDRFYQLDEEPNEMIQQIESVNNFVRHTNAKVIEGGNRACYSPSRDLIRMPRIETFVDAQSHRR